MNWTCPMICQLVRLSRSEASIGPIRKIERPMKLGNRKSAASLRSVGRRFRRAPGAAAEMGTGRADAAAPGGEAWCLTPSSDVMGRVSGGNVSLAEAAIAGQRRRARGRPAPPLLGGELLDCLQHLVRTLP